MARFYRILGVLLGVLLLSLSLNAKENHKVRDDLPAEFEWYVASGTKKASSLLKGNLRKTLQIRTDKQGAITLNIENYDDGSSSFFIKFNSLEGSDTIINYAKDKIQAFLKGKDPRADYKSDHIKLLVHDGILYIGLSKSYF